MVSAVRRKLTFSNVVSLIALFVVLGGTAFAAISKNSIGTKQLKAKAVHTADIANGAVTTKKLKNDAATGAKVKESSLGTVPNATNANNATTATNANQLGGLAAAGYQHRIRWALVNGAAGTTGSGVILAQSGGITASDNAGNTNFNYLDFGENIGNRAILVTINGITQGHVTASPCGSTAPGSTSCAPPGTDDSNHVIIRMRNAADSAGASFRYFVVVAE
jgi:hypothetical protein